MKTPSSTEGKSGCWTRRYEQLREQAVGAVAGGLLVSDRWGLSVLTRRGMSDWMRIWRDPLAEPSAATDVGPLPVIDCGNAWQREATVLLANMAFNAVTNV